MVLLNLKEDPHTIPSNWLDIDPTPKLVFVIRPGAGTYQNKEAYRFLESKFEVVYFGDSGGVFDNYPPQWEDNILVKNKGPHLGGLFQHIKKYIVKNNKIPSAILAGSRGGQVTIGKIWESLWRGPTIIVNAGCLTSQTIIPDGVKIILIAMGNDYFKSVNRPNKIGGLYKQLSQTKEKGYLVYLPKEYHMPNLKTRLKTLYVDCISFIVNNQVTFNISDEIKIFSLD